MSMNGQNLFELEDHFIILRTRKLVTDVHLSQYHSHETYEMYYLLDGVRSYFIRDRTYVLEKGDMVMIDRHDIHKNIDKENEVREGILVAFNRQFLEHDLLQPILDEILETFTRTKLFRFTAAEQSFIESLLLKMVREHGKKDFGYLVYLKATMMELLVWLKRKNESVSRITVRHANSIHEKISDIVKHINQTYMEELTLAGISQTFYISPYHLSRMFKEVTGFTFIEYIHSVRTLESQKLLRDTNLNVTEIAQQVGFDSSTHFGRVFKEQVGCSPLKYRKQYK
ncbi:helix-turn-helix transcriptional regulator [Paenibacillus koleovorans]|uniref:helix-turn-helix transcriptional regulator n=1 Tax=Paenibacillus koleovorans TaxID=121608 RepID=UPI001FE683D9|nr:helix-turn-helix domain-containing protein [Paenibacillus koleovorans]